MSRAVVAPEVGRAERSGGLPLVVLGAVLWGTGGLAGAALADVGVPVVVVATARLLTGGGLLLVVLALAGRLGVRAGNRVVRRRVLLTGALAALYQGSYFLAVELSGVAVATLVALGAAPVVAETATAVLGRRRPSRVVVGALGLALVGLVLLVGTPRGSALGVLPALVSAGAFATTTLVNRHPVPGLGPLALTATSFTAGGLLLLPAAVVVGGAAGLVEPRALALVAFLGVVPTAAAYGAYFTGLRSVPATTATVVALLEPAVATAGAAVLLGERPGVGGVVGGLTLVGAVVLLARASPTMDNGLR